MVHHQVKPHIWKTPQVLVHPALGTASSSFEHVQFDESYKCATSTGDRKYILVYLHNAKPVNKNDANHSDIIYC